MSATPLPFPIPWLVALACAAAPCHADTCEAVAAQIDAKIRAGGVSSFYLQVIDAAASAPGKVVGSCGSGSRKIVYMPTRAAPGAPAAAARPVPPVAPTPPLAGATAVRPPAPAVPPAPPVPPPAKPAPKPAKATTEPILTECLDGTESIGGTCSK